MAASEQPLLADSLYGSEVAMERAAVALLPIPFDATASYGRGSADAWQAIREASVQLDLFDPFFGEPTEKGLSAAAPLAFAAEGNHRCHQHVEAARAGDEAARGRVDAFTDELEASIRAWTRDQLHAGRTPGLVGGEHSVSTGAIHACADAHHGLGILHIDAHHDLRVAYEGFRSSHASAMHRALEHEGVGSLLSVGIRDFSRSEYERAKADARITTLYARDLERATQEEAIRQAVAALPRELYITIDIDGLDPAYCPNTGTPVPGGLSFGCLRRILELVAESGRRVRGFDLVEVCPSPLGSHSSRDEYDANVGARVLFMLCALASEAYLDAPDYLPKR